MRNENYQINQHLNFFNFFREDRETPEIIENNLSRALVICFSHEPLLFDGFIQLIAKDDYNSIALSNDPVYNIDIQVNTKTLQLENYKKVYAIALTSNDFENINEEFNEIKVEDDQEKTITDIIIEINDILFIIEVKPSEANCLYQLKKQVLPFISIVTPISFSWLKVIELMQQKQGVLKMMGQKSFYIDSFISLVEQRFYYWIPTRPLSILPIKNSQISNEVNKRLKLVLENCKNPKSYYYDRTAISVDFGWASEVIPSFEFIDGHAYLAIYIWPGNTKGQGYSIYNEEMNWLSKKDIMINGTLFPLKIEYEIKFCHFNKFVCNIEFSDEDECLKKPIHTLNNFYCSGKKDRGDNDWQEFIKFLDDHFKDSFKWMDECGFVENFIESERQYLTVSFGFIVKTLIPYSTLMELDKNQNDFIKISDMLDASVDAYRNFI